MPLSVRPATADDTPSLCALLNEIIRIGGTTAHETPLDEAEFTYSYISGDGCLTCFVALSDGETVGFQAMARYDDLPEGWGDIGTFARPEPKVPGVGTALFAATKARAEALELRAINATIRADNSAGLAYYAKMGFEDYAITRSVPLKNGDLVDRISKRYWLADV